MDREWGMGNGDKEFLPIPYSPLPTLAFLLCKSSFQFFDAKVPRAGQFFGPLGIFEVLVVQTQHVFARDTVAFARHVDIAYAGFAGVRVANVVEEQRDHDSVLD